ncbi:MAG: protein kinase [Proteobacteria bacterium]|nr:protein kinase [Pseudomonadota bacterium]
MGRQPLPTNTILGNGSDQYRIDTVLGPGGFGITYLARDLRFDRDVALKEYFPADFAYREGTTTVRSSTRGTANDFFDQGKRYFLDEARTLAKFRHEHIVRVLNLFEQFNTAYMVLEFEDGQSLKSWLRNLGRPPTQAELDSLLEPLLSALEVVHAKGMFHRDIAPDNVIVRPNGRPVLIDFGAARNFVREHSHTIGAIVKHGYSPPEQYTLDTKLQGAWSDIYSLSATIYAAMTGVPPEEASKRQLGDTLLPLGRHLPADLSALYRPSFLAALDHGLALKPRDRPQTIAEFRALFAAELHSVPPPERGANSAPSAPRAVASGRAATPESRPSVRVSKPLSRPVDAPSATSSRRPAAQLQPASVRVAEEPDRTPASQAVPLGGGQPAAVAALAEPYPEAVARMSGAIALGLAALAAFVFLVIGGVSHPGGLPSAALVCVSLLAAGAERTISIVRASPVDAARAAVAASVMTALGLAVFWLPFVFWQISLVLVVIAGLFAWLRFGRWVPVTLLVLALVHLAAATLLLAIATRTAQKDPYFLPLMGVSLAALAVLALVSALNIQRQWEAQPS